MISPVMLLSRSALVAAALTVFAGSAFAAGSVPLAELAKPGRVLLLRHAHAPGVGDPPEFRLGDCATQRNLDATGRRQAAQLGRRIVQAGVKGAQIYSSQWCRTLETARLLDAGPVKPLPALNSFFGNPAEREGYIAALRRFLAAQPADGPPLVLVTHQVTITAITGEFVGSGGGTILQLDGSPTPRIVGEIEAN